MVKLSEATVEKKAIVISGQGQRIVVRKTGVDEWLERNVSDLIGAVNHYLSTYMNPKRTPAKVGGFTDLRNKRMVKILEYLQEIEKKENKS